MRDQDERTGPGRTRTWTRDRDGAAGPPPRRRRDEAPLPERPRGTRGLRPRDTPPEPHAPEVWLDEGPVRAAAGAAVARSRSRVAAARPGDDPTSTPAPRAAKRPPRLPGEVVSELVDHAGSARGPKLASRLDDARRAFDRERYTDAKRIVALLARDAPGAASVRELHGLTLYRMDRWKEAAAELEVYRSLTGAVDQHPVLADCYRALRRYAKVDELWAELREASPSAELVAEGRIVAAGALADRGRLAEAVALLEKAPAARSRVRVHHLRQWYALADLYDRAGDPSRARRLFARVRAEAPDFADVAQRVAALGR